MTRTQQFVCGGAMLLVATLGFAETKAGKITSLSLDPATNETTVTVTLGTLNLPERGERKNKDAKAEKQEKPEIVTLGSETVTFVLDKNVAIEPFIPNDAENREARPHGRPARPENHELPPMMQERLAEMLDLGSVVQLSYADDGKTVQTVQVLPDMRLPRMGKGEMMPPMGMMQGRGCCNQMLPPAGNHHYWR